MISRWCGVTRGPPKDDKRSPQIVALVTGWEGTTNSGLCSHVSRAQWHLDISSSCVSSMINPQENKKGGEWSVCQNCFKSGKVHGVQLFLCGRCKNAHYCSVECQKAQWRIHKPNCKLHAQLKQTDVGAMYNKWNRDRRKELTLLAGRLLLDNGPIPLNKTHIVVLNLKFTPPSSFIISDFDEDKALMTMVEFDEICAHFGQSRPALPDIPGGDTMFILINVEDHWNRVLPLTILNKSSLSSSSYDPLKPGEVVDLINMGHNPGKNKKRFDAMCRRYNISP